MFTLRSRIDSVCHIPSATFDAEDGTVVIIDNHCEARIFEGVRWRFITAHSSPDEFNDLLSKCPCSYEIGKNQVCGKPYGHQGGHVAAKAVK